MQPRKDDGKSAKKTANPSKMVAPAPKMATAAPAKMMAAKMATAAPAKMMAAKMATAAPAKMATSAPATHGPSSYAPIEVTPPPPYGSFSSLTEERYATGDRTSVNIDNSQRNATNVMNGGGGGEQGDILNAVLLALLVKKREAVATGPEIAPGLAMFNAPVTADNFPSIQEDIAEAQAAMTTPSPSPAPMFDLPPASPAPAEGVWGAKRVVALALVAASVAASGRSVATGRERLSLFFAAVALASAVVL
jgi:hypothetical protein